MFRDSRTLPAIKAMAVLLLLIYLIAWASISNWQEDHSTTLWIGYTRGLLDMPVGLNSSQGVPNPNGMFLAAFFLSRLPNLFSISVFLGIVQSLLLIGLCRSLFGKSKLWILSAAVLLTSAVIRAIGIEFRNQWVMLIPNCVFLLLVIDYLKKPKILKIPLFVLVSIIPASIYLAGIVNSLVYIIISLFVIFKRKVETSKATVCAAAWITLAVVVGSLWMTWIPYFRTVRIANLLNAAPVSLQPVQKVLFSIGTIVGFPLWSSSYWVIRAIPSIWFFDPKVHPPVLTSFTYLHNFLIMFQAFICFFSFCLAIGRAKLGARSIYDIFSPEHRQMGIWIMGLILFLILSFTLAPLLIGVVWAIGERMDQSVQFFPYFLIVWFTSPFLLNLPANFKKVAVFATYLVSGLFIIVNLSIGVITIASIQQDYKKGQVSPIEIPITEQYRAIQYVVHDWAQKSAQKEIPIYYDFDKGFYFWITDFGPSLDQWYPSPYTFGRSMDYELLHTYGLQNTEEGIPSKARNRENAAYVVSYSFTPASCGEKRISKKAEFGRVKVLVCEQNLLSKK